MNSIYIKAAPYAGAAALIAVSFLFALLASNDVTPVGWFVLASFVSGLTGIFVAVVSVMVMFMLDD